MKIDIKKEFIIVFAGSFLGLFYNYFSPSGIPLIAEKKKMQWAEDSFLFSSDSLNIVQNGIRETGNEKIKNSKTKGKSEKLIKNQNEPNDEVIKKEEQKLSEPMAIHLKQAFQLYKQNVLFIDAREPEDFAAAHIKNAINIPMDHFDDYKSMLDKIDKDQKIVTYCAGSDCDLSIVLGNIMFDSGYKKLYVFFGGWNEWTKANYPIEKENKVK